MAFKPIQKLSVNRTLSTGQVVWVGTLAQNSQGIFFQYNEAYLSSFGNLSPFTLQPTMALQLAPKAPHNGLHGVFADSLPDGWGLLLQDRVFRQQGILAAQLTPLDRLAFVGAKGIGALSYVPESEFISKNETDVDLAMLGLEAQKLFDQTLYDSKEGQTQKVLAALVAAGSSAGARPKAQVYWQANQPNRCRTYAQPGDEAWLVKFTSKNLALGHEEGLCEAVYLQIATEAKCETPKWQLIDAPEESGAIAWLAVKRFDDISLTHSHLARLHMLSACGLLDADFRTPSLDYHDLIKASRQICQSPRVGQLQFRRAVFNLFAANQDDHSKNWSFLQSDNGHWQVAPFYDATFSPHPFNEHATAFDGFGKQPPLISMQKLAVSAGFASWKEAQITIQEVVDSLRLFSKTAKAFGIKKSTVSAMSKVLDQRLKENRGLL